MPAVQLTKQYVLNELSTLAQHLQRDDSQLESMVANESPIDREVWRKHFWTDAFSLLNAGEHFSALCPEKNELGRAMRARSLEIALLAGTGSVVENRPCPEGFEQSLDQSIVVVNAAIAALSVWCPK